MSYDIELRQRVIDFVESGGKKAEAARIFQVSRATIYNWLSRDSLEPTLRVPSERK
ncbi:IS630 transposase-related protein, partial [Magnetococcus sp. PR-3]|uniref:IS630 transposase-related protein n=1 Tax=Magnetococcus sp. PR-3 TaxID=3120355 RepID=UPI003FA5D39A